MQNLVQPDLEVADYMDVSVGEESTDELVAVGPDVTKHRKVEGAMKRKRSTNLQEKIVQTPQTPYRQGPARSCKRQNVMRRYSEAVSPIDVREIAESP